MKLSPDIVTKVVHAAAWRASKHMPTCMDRNDLRQIGRLALLEADRAGRFDACETEAHLFNKARKRAFGAMVDEIRHTFGQMPARTISTDADDYRPHFYATSSTSNPERSAQVRQAVARLARKGSETLLDCVRLLASGMSNRAVAAEMNLHPSRISQLKSRAMALMSPCI